MEDRAHTLRPASCCGERRSEESEGRADSRAGGFEAESGGCSWRVGDLERPLGHEDVHVPAVLGPVDAPAGSRAVADGAEGGVDEDLLVLVQEVGDDGPLQQRLPSLSPARHVCDRDVVRLKLERGYSQ